MSKFGLFGQPAVKQFYEECQRDGGGSRVVSCVCGHGDELIESCFKISTEPELGTYGTTQD